MLRGMSPPTRMRSRSLAWRRCCAEPGSAGAFDGGGWVADRGEAQWDANGKGIRLSGVTEDMSNVKRVQEVLESRTNELEEAQNKIEQEMQNVRKF